MLIFKTLKYSNFLSVGDNEITIDFLESKSTLIVGHNGSGKSLMLDALSFALFGKPHRNINKPQLVNSINGKGCHVEVEFSIGKKEYKIVRGIKPNLFEIWVDGNMINQESHSRDYQKLLETNILKLNHKSFHQVVVLGSSNFTPFMQHPVWTRRGIIEDLLDIGIFSKMNAGLKETQAKLKDQIKDTEYNLNLSKEKISMQNKHIDKLNDISKNNVKKLDKEIAELRGQADKLIENNKSATKKYQSEYAKTASQHKKNQDAQTKLEYYKKQILDNIKKVTKESTFFESTETCPTCQQHLDDEIKEQKIHECSHQLVEYKDGNEQLEVELEKARCAVDKTTKSLNDLVEVNKQLSNNSTLISNYETSIAKLQEKKNESGSNEDLVKAKAELQFLRDTRDKLSDTRSLQTEEQHYNDIIAELLKDTGIKTKIIRQYLPVMNKLINQYLQVLDFFVLFNLDENFNETILSRHRDSFSYSSFSEGEKQRIDLALLFAWRQVAKMKNSANTNLLILDETFDSSLDPEGIDNLLRILSTLDEGTRVFVISHKQEILEGRFDRKIEFERRQNFTKIKSIS